MFYILSHRGHQTRSKFQIEKYGMRDPFCLAPNVRRKHRCKVGDQLEENRYRLQQISGTKIVDIRFFIFYGTIRKLVVRSWFTAKPNLLPKVENRNCARGCVSIAQRSGPGTIIQ